MNVNTNNLNSNSNEINILYTKPKATHPQGQVVGLLCSKLPPTAFSYPICFA